MLRARYWTLKGSALRIRAEAITGNSCSLRLINCMHSEVNIKCLELVRFDLVQG